MGKQGRKKSEQGHKQLYTVWKVDFTDLHQANKQIPGTKPLGAGNISNQNILQDVT